MSLINDALKRARQAHKKPPADQPPDGPLQPVENSSPNRRHSVVVLGGSVVVLLLGLWFLWQWWNPSKPTQVASSSAPATNKPPPAAKSSIASNLTRPFQAVAKLDAALKEARQTEALAPTSQPQIVSTSAPVRPVEPITASSPTNTASAAPPAEKSSNVISASPPTATNEPVVRLPSRNVTFPSLKLQGIYLRMSKPSALINNRTVFLGDEVDGVRVVGIERFSVKVEMKGVTNEFFLK